MEVTLPEPTTPSDAQSLSELVYAYRKHKAELDALETKMNILKQQIRPLVEANGKYQDELGYARIVTPNPTVTYDKDALDALSASDLALHRILSPHRRETPKQPYLQIK